jgi:predicted enzyme related to lactoylglutathione lyase
MARPQRRDARRHVQQAEGHAGPAAWLYYIHIADVTEAVTKVELLGGQVLNGPMEVPGGSFIAQCLDPQGAAFALHSHQS